MMRNDPTDSILNKISENNQSYVQLSYYIKARCTPEKLEILTKHSKTFFSTML